MRVRRITVAIVAGGFILGAFAAPASADPRKGEVIPLTCDNGQQYTIVVNGNGAFTPGHVVDSTSVFVPLSFGPFTGTLTDANGKVVETFTEPGESKGQSGKRARNTVTCSFTFTGTENGLTFTGSGTVTGFITPRKRS